MIPNIVGPRLGATDLKVSAAERKPDKDFKNPGPDSFDKALTEKISSQDMAGPKDNGRTENKEEPQQQQAGNSEAQAKPEQEVASNDGLKKEDPARQKAIKKFMDSFESEFQIPSTRLVEAIAKLDKSQQQQPPEDTAKAVIDQLHLPKEDAEKAQALYASLLLQLHQIDQQPKKDLAMAGAAGGGAFFVGKTFMKPGETAGKVGPESFFGKPSMKDGSLPATSAAGMVGAGKINGEMAGKISVDSEDSEAATAGVTAGEAADKQHAAQGKEALQKLPPHVQGQMKENMSPALQAALAAQKAQMAQAPKASGENAAEGAEDGEEGTQSTEGLATASKASATKADSSKLTAMALGEAASKEASQNGQEQASMQNQHQAHDGLKGMTADKDLAKSKLMAKATEFKQSLSDSQQMNSVVSADGNRVDTLKNLSAAPVAATAGAQVPTQAEHDATVKQLMNQAQYLVKKGGGEVKVQMSPEGMGTIHLKVMLQNGKVNLQMSANTPEAKKMLESSLAELKTSLAAHKLSVDHVKVDVVGAASADVATQNQTQNQNGHSQRDSNRQFWNQFQDSFGSEERRQAQMEMPPNLKGYGTRRPEPLHSIDTKSAPRSVEGKGRGLNLVA